VFVTYRKNSLIIKWSSLAVESRKYFVSIEKSTTVIINLSMTNNQIVFIKPNFTIVFHFFSCMLFYHANKKFELNQMLCRTKFSTLTSAPQLLHAVLWWLKFHGFVVCCTQLLVTSSKRLLSKILQKS